VKERKKITEIAIKESAEVCSIKTNEDGTYSLIDSNGNCVEHIQIDSVGYLRDSGKPKILRSISRSDDDRHGDNPWKKYDKIGFIDTNSIVADERKLFVSSPSLLLWEDENRRFANIHHVDLLVGYCSGDVNPERIGWADFIQRMQASKLLKTCDRMLIVVDSDKSLIPSINERHEPVFMDFVLPGGFTLAYATSDSGTESWINKEMKRRNKVAGRALSSIIKNDELRNLLAQNWKLYIKNDFEEKS
jgi:hypothetical protein